MKVNLREGLDEAIEIIEQSLSGDKNERSWTIQIAAQFPRAPFISVSFGGYIDPNGPTQSFTYGRSEGTRLSLAGRILTAHENAVKVEKCLE